MDYLFFGEVCARDFPSRMGGDASLPAAIEWPRDKDGKPMLLLMTLASTLISTYLNNRLPENYGISVFVPFEKDSVEHVVDLARRPETARVIAHEIAPDLRQECHAPLVPPHAITIEVDADREDEDEFSDEIENKIGGKATWLQDRIELYDKQFLLQVGAGLFDRYWPSHRGIFMGGMVYLFVNKAGVLLAPQFGQLTVQYT